MDSSLTSSKSTPFSINDILMKTNSEMFRRYSSSDSISTIPRKSCSENRDCDHHIDEATDELSQHLANQMRFFKYSSGSYGHNSGVDELNGVGDEFLYNNNHSTVNNNHGKITLVNDERGRQQGADKSMKSMRFYNFPLVMERPLDMRRCNNDDDSGRPQRIHLKSHILFYC